jgi:hypothetical protein
MERRNAIKGLAAALGGLVAIPGCKRFPEGVTCYDPIVEYYVDYVCSHCNGVTKEKYNNWIVHIISQIEDIVKKIKELEYDVVLDKTEFCPHCSETEIENPVLIFKIRFSDEAGYHVVRSNIVNEYQCMLEFLSNPDEFLEKQDEKTLQEKIAIIRKMTGLGEDLKFEKQ